MLVYPYRTHTHTHTQDTRNGTHQLKYSNLSSTGIPTSKTLTHLTLCAAQDVQISSLAAVVPQNMEPAVVLIKSLLLRMSFHKLRPRPKHSIR